MFDQQPGELVSLNLFLARYNAAFAAHAMDLGKKMRGKSAVRKTMKEWCDLLLARVVVDIHTNGANRP